MFLRFLFFVLRVVPSRVVRDVGVEFAGCVHFLSGDLSEFSRFCMGMYQKLEFRIMIVIWLNCYEIYFQYNAIQYII